MRMRKTVLLLAVITCLCGTLWGCSKDPEKKTSDAAPSSQSPVAGAEESTPAEPAPGTESETPAEDLNKISAEEAADVFGISIVLPGNANWIENDTYYLVDENNLKITYRDLIAGSDCTLLVSKNGTPDLPSIEYEETRNEIWEGQTVSGQTITVSVQHEGNGGKMTLAVWKYGDCQFAILGEDDSGAIPKVALNIIKNLEF